MGLEGSKGQSVARSHAWIAPAVQLLTLSLISLSAAAAAYPCTVPKLKVRISAKFCWMCNTTLTYVIATSCTLQLELGHISDADGRGGGPIVAYPVICPLFGLMVTGRPRSSPNVTSTNFEPVPSGLVHFSVAVPPDDVRNTPVGMFASPATLKLAVRLPPGFTVIVGVPMKCGDAAAARIGVISSKADVIIAVAEGIPIFFMLSDIIPRLRGTNHVNTCCELVI